ncbi:ABC transporter permease [Antarcticimicrobium sediminis]|uniref:ABC transporter permease n=1 Tax=Antarcticimicrobium sediminis TaxID=2546227 RepID=A0A4V2Z7J6_9RHOB|nr:ABC transporter permease [Antarcticimicrobium sediminis]TDE36716.1 ABC transporter permease [Antarcticimicrobium sediminis]
MSGPVVKLLMRRLLTVIPTLIMVSLLLFCVLRLLPVDAAAMSLPPNATNDEIAAMRIEMGLDLPLIQQYGIWFGDMIQGDFGTSIHFRTAVSTLVLDTLPATIELAVMAMGFATVFGVLGGLWLFYARGGAVEVGLDLGSVALLSIPEFLWALFFMLLFGVSLDLLPFIGRLGSGVARPETITGFLLIDSLLSGNMATFMDALRHMILPSVALGLSAAPPIMRILRSSLMDVYQEDYIHQARQRGISEGRILIRHALKNAFLPTLSLMGVQFGFLFGGTLLVEIIFSYPGMGNLMVDAIRNADLPIIQTVGLTYCVMVLLISIVVDVLYLVLNPKLREA